MAQRSQGELTALLACMWRMFYGRMYAVITDRAPYAAWLHEGYLRFADVSVSDSAGSTNGTLDRLRYIANAQ